MIAGISKEAVRARDLALWQRLHAAGLVNQPTMPKARSETPWFLRAIPGIAAWVAALLLTLAVGFLMIDNWRDMPETGFAAAGALLALAAAAGLRAKLGTFLSQSLISFSLAGQLMVACGLILFHSITPERALAGGAAVLVLAAALYLINRVSLHRFICGVAMAAGLYFMLSGNPISSALDGNGMVTMSVLLPLVLSCVAVGLWLLARPIGAHPGLAPLTWAFTLCAMAETFTNGYYGEPLSLVMPSLYLISLLPGIFAALLMWPNRARVGNSLAIGLPLVLLLLAPVWLRLPGVGLALIWILGGFALPRPLLLAFGLACLPIYLVRYVYLLDLSLLEKSVWLSGAGVGLLLLWGLWQALINRRARQAIAAGTAQAVNPESAT